MVAFRLVDHLTKMAYLPSKIADQSLDWRQTTDRPYVELNTSSKMRLSAKTDGMTVLIWMCRLTGVKLNNVLSVVAKS